MNFRHRAHPAVAAGALSMLAVLSVLASGCSSGGSATPTSTSSPPKSAGVTATTSSGSSVPASGAGLSGNWTGHYEGAFIGSFHLSLQQSGSTLTGTITLSKPALTSSVSGSFSDGEIHFGSVGSTTITYNGQGGSSSMGGTYQVNGSSGGTWAAVKS